MTVAMINHGRVERLIDRAKSFTRLDRKKTVVLFAGAGGSCMGIEEAHQLGGLDQGVDVAINHDPDAIACHKANHPLTEHRQCDVFEVDPESVEGEIGGLWGSPDCTDFSKAKGGKPIRTVKRRSLAWVMVHWAFVKKIDVLMLENVEEFEDWGPLRQKRRANGKPLWHYDPAFELQFDDPPEWHRMHRTRGLAPVLEPDPDRRGETFKLFVQSLLYLGYKVEWRILRAGDFGTPTTRKRLFMIARRDGKPITWPEPTHGRIERAAPGSSMWRCGRCEHVFRAKQRKACPKCSLAPELVSAGCIDFDVPMLSIFATAEEAKVWAREMRACGYDMGTPRRPLKPNTEKRIASGLVRYAIEDAEPFIVRCAHGEGSWGHGPRSLDEPMPTLTGSKDFAIADVQLAPITAGAGGPVYAGKPRRVDRPHGSVMTENHSGLAAAMLSKYRGSSPGHRMDEPAPTITAGGGNRKRTAAAPHALGLTTAVMVPRYGERKGQKPRARRVTEPMPTVVPDGNGATLATAIMAGVGGREGQTPPQTVDRPCKTITGKNDKALATALLKHFGGVVGQRVEEPLGTVTATDHNSLLSALLVHMNHGEKQWSGVNEPLRTVVSGNHAALVHAHLIKFYKSGGQWSSCDEPVHTIPSKERMAIVEAVLSNGFDEASMAGFRRVWAFLRKHLGEDAPPPIVVVKGALYVIVDIFMRMLLPRELARAQGFRDDYIIDRGADGRKLSKATQVRLIGNSVCRQVARALWYENVVKQDVLWRAAA